MSKPTPGLRKRGQIWHIEKVIAGQRICESTGETTLEGAERYLAKRTEEIRAVTVYGERPRITFDHAAARFDEEHAGLKTIDRYEYSLAAVMPYIGHVSLQDIHQAKLTPFIDARQAAGISDGTIKRDIAAIKRVLTYAATVWRDDKNRPLLDSVPLLKAPQGKPKKPRPITREEQTLLFAQLPAYLAEMALFAVNTGLRAQELCGLKWEWEYTLSGTTHTVFVLPEEVTKNGKERIVPLNAAARSVIETRRPRGGEYVFGTNDTKLSRPTNRAWNKARKLTGIDARWHDLRHTFGSRLRSAGVNEEDRADLLGHHKGSITTHYSQAQIQHLIACVEKLCETDTQKPEMTLIKRKK